MTKTGTCLALWIPFILAPAPCPAADLDPAAGAGSRKGPSAEHPRWRFKRTDEPASRTDLDDSGWDLVSRGHSWKAGAREPAWLRTTVVIPESIEGKPTRGEPVGMRISAGDLEEIHVDGVLRSRGDNDHPGMALLAEKAEPGARVAIAVRAWPGSAGGEPKLEEDALCLVDAHRAREPYAVRIVASRKEGPMTRSVSGVSQGGGMCDHEPATAKKLRDLGIRWFRMDNVLTSAVKAVKKDGRLEYDWTDLDRRADFIAATGAQAILCLSYMPQPLDAVPNNERHSVPKDYGLWETLCRDAARRCLERGKRVKCWEVWNETNSGWLDPGPGKDRLDAYLRLYEASARGVRAADPEAWIGGPANASGPWDRSPERGYCVDGEKFLRGLLERCEAKRLPLDFISWHEYFQPPWIFREEVLATRAWIDRYPAAKGGVKALFITEWNYAWWPDPAQDCELGAAWCADTALRVLIPLGVDAACFFYVKDGDEDFRGSYAMLQGPGNRPKPSYNVLKLFSLLGSERIACEAPEDGEVSALATIDPAGARVALLLVNYAQRYGIGRRAEVAIEDLPERARKGKMRRLVVDAVHSNAWNDRGKADLECVETMPLDGSVAFRTAVHLRPASVTLIEIAPE